MYNKKKLALVYKFPFSSSEMSFKQHFVKYFQVILSKTDTLDSNATQVNNFFQKVIDNIRECSTGFFYT